MKNMKLISYISLWGRCEVVALSSRTLIIKLCRYRAHHTTGGEGFVLFTKNRGFRFKIEGYDICYIRAIV